MVVLLLIYGRDGKDFEIGTAINVWEEKDFNFMPLRIIKLESFRRRSLAYRLTSYPTIYYYILLYSYVEDGSTSAWPKQYVEFIYFYCAVHKINLFHS